MRSHPPDLVTPAKRPRPGARTSPITDNPKASVSTEVTNPNPAPPSSLFRHGGSAACSTDEGPACSSVEHVETNGRHEHRPADPSGQRVPLVSTRRLCRLLNRRGRDPDYAINLGSPNLVL